MPPIRPDALHLVWLLSMLQKLVESTSGQPHGRECAVCSQNECQCDFYAPVVAIAAYTNLQCLACIKIWGSVRGNTRVGLVRV